MSNVVYEDKHYNADRKKEYMSQYAEGTQKILDRLFKVSNQKETDLNKDLCEFNREQLRQLFFLYMPKTSYSSRANVQWVSAYIDWTISNGYLDGLNPLDGTDKQWKEQFVNRVAKKYWTEKEIDRIINKLVNAQDAVVVRLLFEGARGTGNSEILHLMKHDIDEQNNQLRLTDEDGSKRTITVSEKCIKLCLAALRETDYEKMNGNPSKDIKAPTAALVDNDYVVKSSHTRTINFDEAAKEIVHRRLSNIADEIGETNFSSPLNITNSGMLAKAAELYQLTGKLDDEEYEMIFNQFGETSEQSRYRIKQEFLNSEHLKQYYGIS